MRDRILRFYGKAYIAAAASVVGGSEYEGPLGDCFDMHDPTDKFGMKTWEMAESEMQRRAFGIAMKRGEVREEDIDALFAGDLLNQCVGSAYGLSEFKIPYFGLYGACSTCAEGLILASAMTSATYCRYAAAVRSLTLNTEMLFGSPERRIRRIKVPETANTSSPHIHRRIIFMILVLLRDIKLPFLIYRRGSHAGSSSRHSRRVRNNRVV